MTVQAICAAVAAVLWLAVADGAAMSAAESLRLQENQRRVIRQEAAVSNIGKAEHDTAAGVVSNLR